jgi:hypothetical protein
MLDRSRIVRVVGHEHLVVYGCRIPGRFLPTSFRGEAWSRKGAVWSNRAGRT